MKRIIILSIALILISVNSFGQKFPLPEYPYTLVNDQSKILTTDEFDVLEIKLGEFYEKTSVRVIIIIVDDLEGLDISDYSSGITNEWNVNLSNTPKIVLVMIKPKLARSKMEVLITAGFDMKEFIPDPVAKMIVENEIIPEFRKKKFYSGLFRATDVIEALVKQEISWKEYLDNNQGSFSKTFKEYALNVALVLLILFLTGRFLAKYRRKTEVRRPKPEE